LIPRQGRFICQITSEVFLCVSGTLAGRVNGIPHNVFDNDPGIALEIPGEDVCFYVQWVLV